MGASGSTKDLEFATLRGWLMKALAKGRYAEWRIASGDLIDVLSGRKYGLAFTFRRGDARKSLYVLFDWKPVNFLFYGVTTEDIDLVLAQLLDVSVALLQNPGASAEVHAVDYSPLATNNVLRAYGSIQEHIPVPAPEGTEQARAFISK